MRRYFARWMAELPQPLTAEDRAAGRVYALSMIQLEVSDTRVFDRPRDVGVGKRLDNLTALRAKGDAINARLLALEHGTEEARLAGPELTDLVLPARRDGRRVPALRIGDPRVMALLAALVASPTRPLGSLTPSSGAWSPSSSPFRLRGTRAHA